MGVRRILGSGAALVALALIAPAAASADGTLQPHGALVYTWHGDPAHGCAKVGVCGVQGTLTIRPQDPVFFFAPSPGPSGELDLSGALATVRVRRTEAGSSGDCVDTGVWPNVGDGSVPVEWHADGRALAMIPVGDGPSSGRCAGPLSSDLPADLTGRRLPGRALRLTFAGTQSFVAGPYSGTLVSTLSFAPDNNGGFSSSSGGGSSSGPGVRRTLLDERIMITLRADAAPSTVVATMRGAPDTSCMVFDSCATTGSISLAFAHLHGRLLFEADRIVSHRLGHRQVLADFRAGRLTYGLPFPGPLERFSVGETLARAGGATCSDQARIQPDATVWLGSPFGADAQRTTSSGVPILLSLGDGPSTFVRTHCPGPASSDVFGTDSVLARARLRATDLLARHTTIVLRAGGGFSAGGYAGARSGAVTLKLSVSKIVARTFKVPA